MHNGLKRAHLVNRAVTVALNAAVDTTYVLDGFAVGNIHTVTSVNRVAGGKANNVARVLQLLGVPLTATGCLGGANGRFIEQDLRSRGIHTAFRPIPNESRVCLALVDRTGQTVTEVREKGPLVCAEWADAFLQYVPQLLTDAQATVLSGSLPPGLPVDYYKLLTSVAKAAGTFVVLDASGSSLGAALCARPDLVKPNRDELAHWAGCGLPTQAHVVRAARQMLAEGAGAVAVSLGKEGLMYVGAEGVWLVQPPAVQVVNTVGSGDSLVAGMVAATLQGLPIEERLRLGVACGTANALSANVACPQLDEIATIKAQVICSKVE